MEQLIVILKGLGYDDVVNTAAAASVAFLKRRIKFDGEPCLDPSVEMFNSYKQTDCMYSEPNLHKWAMEAAEKGRAWFYVKDGKELVDDPKIMTKTEIYLNSNEWWDIVFCFVDDFKALESVRGLRYPIYIYGRLCGVGFEPMEEEKVDEIVRKLGVDKRKSFVETKATTGQADYIKRVLGRARENGVEV